MSLLKVKYIKCGKLHFKVHLSLPIVHSVLVETQVSIVTADSAQVYSVSYSKSFRLRVIASNLTSKKATKAHLCYALYTIFVKRKRRKSKLLCMEYKFEIKRVHN